MPYQPHRDFDLPDPQMPIWRYMTLPKFLAQLSHRALHLTRADKLGDPAEGRVSIKDSTLMETLAGQGAPRILEVYRAMPKYVVASCWHAQPGENSPMWGAYLGNQDGVAIMSTPKSIQDAMGSYPLDVYMGLVRYVDYAVDVIGIGNSLRPFIYKRKEFEAEKEFRVVMVRWPDAGHDEWPDYGHDLVAPGNALIGKVVLKPGTPSWLEGVLRQTVEKFGHKLTVERSSLDRIPP